MNSHVPLHFGKISVAMKFTAPPWRATLFPAHPPVEGRVIPCAAELPPIPL